MYDIFRREDPVAAAVFREHLTWEEQHRTFTIMMTTIISKSADPATLEKTLRPLGERHFARGVSPTVVQRVYPFFFLVFLELALASSVSLLDLEVPLQTVSFESDRMKQNWRRFCRSERGG